MKYFIDTNIFLRALIRDEEKQFEQCIKLLNLVTNLKVDGHTSSIILSEVVWTLSKFYKYSKADIVKSVEYIMNLSGIDYVNNFDDMLAIKLFAKHSVKYIDCQIASIPEIFAKKMTVISYDSDFKKLPILWKKPSRVIQELS